MSSMAENSPTPSDPVTVHTLRSIIGSSISLSEQDRHGCKEHIPQSPNSATILTSEINSQPQDFVVLSGKNFKVKRSILRPEFNAILRSSSANLKESFESISSDISLSRYGCLFDSSSTKVNPPSSSSSSSGSHKQSLADRLALNSTDRRRLEHSNSKIIDSCHDPIQRAFSSSLFAGEELVDDCTSLSLTAPASLMSSNPISSSSGSSQGSGSSHLVRRLLHARSLSQSSAFSEVSSPGSSEGYYDAADASAPCCCPPLRGMVSPVEVAAAAAESARFYWKEKQGIHLFIAHDNPQLGKTVHSFIVCSKGDPSSSAASAGMQCMLEFKDQSEPRQKTVFLLGTIIYSGPFSGIEDAEVLQPRGSACLVVCDIRAVRGDVKQLATRTPREGGDIIEIDLLSDHVPAGFTVPLACADELKALLQSCKEKVDVILDPYHCSGDDDAAQQWFPYWEGTRRMAPQFRSKGIGYLRLGDDMSQYGVAFLSLDAGATYLDDGATSIVAKGARGPGGLQLVDHHAKTSVPSTTHRLGAKHNSLQQSAAMRDCSKAAQVVGLMDSNAAATTIGDAAVAAKEGSMWRLKEALQGLKDSAHSSTSDKPTSLKWNERSELLVSIASQLRELSIASASSSSPEEPMVSSEEVSMHVNTFTELVLLLTDIVTKKVNPQMLSSSMLCLQALQCGEVLWSHSHCSVPWRHLVLESIHLLRSNNKHVQECARNALTHLYTAKSITLPLLEGMLDEVIVGSRVQAANHLHPHLQHLHSNNNNNSKTLLHSAANTSRVIQWLDSLIVAELDGLIADDGYIPVGVGKDRSDREAATRGARRRRIGVGCLLRRCGQLLAHREEVTRESSTALTTHLLALDVLQNILLADDADDAAVEQLSELSTSLSLASSAASTDEKKQQHMMMMQSLIIHVVTANIRPVIADMSATNGRYYKKILGSLCTVLNRYSASLSYRSSTADSRRGDRGVDRREEASIQVGSCDEVKTDSSPGGDHHPHPCQLLLSAASGQAIQKSIMQSSLSSLKRRSRATATTRLQQGSSVAVACTDGSTAGADASLQELLSRDWFEAKMLLRRRPQSDAEWDEQVKARAVVFLTMQLCDCRSTFMLIDLDLNHAPSCIYLAFLRPSRELRSSSATSPPCPSPLVSRAVPS